MNEVNLNAAMNHASMVHMPVFMTWGLLILLASDHFFWFSFGLLRIFLHTLLNFLGVLCIHCFRVSKGSQRIVLPISRVTKGCLERDSLPGTVWHHFDRLSDLAVELMYQSSLLCVLCSLHSFVIGELCGTGVGFCSLSFPLGGTRCLSDRLLARDHFFLQCHSLSGLGLGSCLCVGLLGRFGGGDESGAFIFPLLLLLRILRFAIVVALTPMPPWEGMGVAARMVAVFDPPRDAHIPVFYPVGLLRLRDKLRPPVTTMEFAQGSLSKRVAASDGTVLAKHPKLVDVAANPAPSMRTAEAPHNSVALGILELLDIRGELCTPIVSAEPAVVPPTPRLFGLGFDRIALVVHTWGTVPRRPSERVRGSLGMGVAICPFIRNLAAAGSIPAEEERVRVLGAISFLVKCLPAEVAHRFGEVLLAEHRVIRGRIVTALGAAEGGPRHPLNLELGGPEWMLVAPSVFVCLVLAESMRAHLGRVVPSGPGVVVLAHCVTLFSKIAASPVLAV